MEENNQPDPKPEQAEAPQAQAEAETKPAPDLVLTPLPEKAEQAAQAKPDPEPAPKEEKPAPGPQLDPAELERLARDYEQLKQSHETLTETLQRAQKDRRLQVMRSAGVEVLGDDELLKLAPEVDPDTIEGRQKINDWIEKHQGLVSPRFKIQPKRDAEIASSAIENHAVKTLFGNAETVRKRIKNLMGD